MEGFSTTLFYRGVDLSSASEVARLSFLLHKSISYLDLETCSKMMISNISESRCCCCTFEMSNYLINTEEKCRKYFIPSRSVLYNLHLDLPKGREYPLNQFPENIVPQNYEDVGHLVKLMPEPRFYDKILSKFIAEIIEDKSKKLDTLKRLLKFTISGMSYLYYLEIETAKEFIDLFYPTITVPELFKNFIMNFDIIDWIITYEDPEITEYLLYNARHFGREDLMGKDYEHIIEFCIFQHVFKNISPVLKFMNVPNIPLNEGDQYHRDIVSMRPDLDNDEFLEVADEINETRFSLMMQLVWIFLKGYQRHSDDVALDVLRLIWCSISVPYISFQEMSIFKKGLSAEELQNIYDFYARAIGGKLYETTQPRSLQHMCRTVIRRTLEDNKTWIPEGISLTGLSDPLQSFLNLENIDVYPKSLAYFNSHK